LIGTGLSPSGGDSTDGIGVSYAYAIALCGLDTFARILLPVFYESWRSRVEVSNRIALAIPIIPEAIIYHDY